MKLLAFKIQHFRCLHSTDWIPFSELSIFTGENDAGKSATLHALEIFLSPKRVPTRDDYSLITPVTDGTSEIQITLSAKFDLRDSESALLKEIWDIDEKVIEVKRVFQADLPTAPYVLSAQTYADDVFTQPLGEYTVPDLKKIASQFAIDIATTRVKQEIVNAVFAWAKTQPKVPADVKLPNSLVDSLPDIQIFSSESALDPESEIHRTLATQFKSLIATDKYSGRISDITKQIESDLNSELEKLSPFVKAYSNDVETVTIRPNFNFASGLSTTELQLQRNDGRPILLKRSGAGQRRRLSLAVYEWSQEIFRGRNEDSRQLIMAFDEPDTHLDYKSQRQIFDVIRRFGELPAIQVVVCTHSLNFIERVPIDRIVHYSLEHTVRHSKIEILAIADHATTELFMYEIGKNMGLRNSVMLHERCFLVVEGPTEMTALPVLFYKKFHMPLQSAGICLLNGEGNYGARMLIKFLNSNKRPVLFLVDSDAITTDGLQKHFKSSSFVADGIEESTQVHYVGTKEFEDAFSDDLWIRMAELHYPKKSSAPWTVEDFTSLRASPKFSKNLQNRISILSELEYEPPKSELGYKLAQCIEESEIPPTIVACLQRAFDFANA